MCVCVHVYVYVCMHYVCVCVCMYVCICVHEQSAAALLRSLAPSLPVLVLWGADDSLVDKVPYVPVWHVFLMCLPDVSACLMCLPDVSALCVCLMCLP